jgi:hypothetical protein
MQQNSGRYVDRAPQIKIESFPKNDYQDVMITFSKFASASLIASLLATGALAGEIAASTLDPLTFVERQKISSNDGATDDQFGWTMAVAGNTALISAPNTTIGTHAGQGSVYVFTRTDAGWVQTQKLTANDGGESDAFGISVALAGSTAIIGAPNNNSFRGAAYVFQLTGGTWVQTQKLVASDGTDFNQFGWSVAQNSRVALIGSIGATFGVNTSQGAVFAFEQTGGTWNETQKFSSADGVSGDSFGWSIGLEGENAVVGTGFVTVNGNDFQGAAYTFRRTGSVWSETQKLTADNGDAFDFFGLAVALEGNNILIGADGAATDGNPFSNQGAVYRFTRSDAGWSLTQTLSASDGESSDSFGTSIALQRGTALIGATGVTVDGAESAGAAYVFETSDHTMVETQKLTASDPGENNYYGWSGAVSGKSVFVGAYIATADGHERQGAVYVQGPLRP